MRGQVVLKFWCAGALAAAAACAARAPGPGPEKVAAASIAPLADLLAQVAGPGWQVRTIVPPGTSAHIFEPLPKDVKKLASARLLFTVGAGYDSWAAKLASAAAVRPEVVDGAAVVGIAGSGSEEDEGKLASDPHWWLSPPLAARAVAALGVALARVDPVEAGAYRRRAAACARSLALLDAETERLLAPVRGRAFIASHAAWVHFAHRYGIREVAAIESVPGREPSPRALVSLIESARRERMTTLFTEPQFPPAAARVIADEAGLRLVLLDPIGGVPGREGYEATLRFDAAQLAANLGPRP